MKFALSQQQHPAVRSQPTAVKRGCDFLATNCWESKSGCAIIFCGGCRTWHFLSRCRTGLGTQFPTASQCVTLLPTTPQAPPGA
jgi:hypothetical protein